MANVIETAKAGITAYNDKDWSKAKDILAADAVYDEKGTHRRIKGVGEINRCLAGLGESLPRLQSHIRARVRERGHRRPRDCVERRSHWPTADTNGYHSAVKQADRDAGMPGRPGRGR
jgi:hypothetical protein